EAGRTMTEQGVNAAMQRFRRAFAPNGRIRQSLRVLGSLALGTLLLMAGAFFAWQAWLVYRLGKGAEEAEQTRVQLVAELGADIRQTIGRVQGALARDDVQQALWLGESGRAPA